MESQIKIDFIDRGTGKGIEPVIRVELRNSQDPRDKLIAVLFESLHEQCFLQFYFTNHKRVMGEFGEPDMQKTAILFKPEIDTNGLFKGTDLVIGDNGAIHHAAKVEG